MEILDDRGNILRRFLFDVSWDPKRWKRGGHRVIAFGDVDGDGLQDAVLARPGTSDGRPLEIHIRQNDGSLVLEASHATTDRFEYEGTSYQSFHFVDVHCADFDGDGKAEIVVAENSAAFFPSTVRIVSFENELLFQLWHPGALDNARTGDRDGDGVPELYVGATCNFLTPPESNTSDPVFMMIEADWRLPDLRLDLFGPRRRLEAALPAGMRLLYTTWSSVRLGSLLSPWQFASVFISESRDPATYLDVSVSTVREVLLGVESDRKISLRTAYFNPDLELIQTQWNPFVTETLGIDPTTPESKALLEPRYWTGSGWQPEPCFVQ